MTSLPEPIAIASAQGAYRVDFFPSVRDALAATAEIEDSVFLVDQNVLNLYRKEMAPVLDGRRHLPLSATEEEKTIEGVTRVVNWLQANDCTKRSTVIAVGGGIIQDIATFSSHIYYRGIPWVFLPTTLLAMSDSCIGAKCGINLNEFKNQLGVFQSPSRVIIASSFIDTLSERDVASGHGEILKLLLTGTPGGLDKLYHILQQDGLRTTRLPELIHASLDVKKEVIEKDEYESDLRRILNYGHTFGHALESLTTHEVPHGLAVAWGIDVVNHIAVERGLLDYATFERIHSFIGDYLPFRYSRRITASELIAASKRDKKAGGGTVNLILLRDLGKLAIVNVRFDLELERQLTDYLEKHDVFRGD